MPLKEQTVSAVNEALRRMEAEPIKTATVVMMSRTVYHNKQNVTCYAYSSRDSAGSVFIYREPGELANWWFVEHYAGTNEHYWGTLPEIGVWLYKRGIYPIFGEAVDNDIIQAIAE